MKNQRDLSKLILCFYSTAIMLACSDGVLDTGGSFEQNTDIQTETGDSETDDSETDGSDSVEMDSSTDVVSECDGVVYENICWYLGERNQSCDEVCADKGGTHENAWYYLTNESPEHCANIFYLLTGSGWVQYGFPGDGVLLSCYRDYSGTQRYLISEWFDPSHKSFAAERVCGCIGSF